MPDRKRTSNRLSRRDFLTLGGSGLIGASLLACSNGSGKKPTPSPARTSFVDIVPTPPTANLSWEQLPVAGVLPAARRDHSLVTDGQRLLLFGGRDAATMGDLWSYDLITNAWTELAPTGAAARFGHNAIWDQQGARMIVFGGQADAGAFFNDTWAFDPAADAWTQLAQGGLAPAARYGAGGAYDPNGRMFVTHGFTDTGRFDDTWALDLAGDSWSEITPEGDLPIARCLIRAAWDPLQELIFIFGGQTNETPFLDDLWSYALSSNWRTLEREPKPTARNLYAMILDTERQHLFMLGGNTETGPSGEIWLYDVASERWNQPPISTPGPPPRYGHDAVWLQDQRAAIVFGGHDGTQGLNDLWKLTDAS